MLNHLRHFFVIVEMSLSRSPKGPVGRLFPQYTLYRVSEGKVGFINLALREINIQFKLCSNTILQRRPNCAELRMMESKFYVDYKSVRVIFHY